MNCSKCKYWTFFQTDRLSGADWGKCSRLEECPQAEIFAITKNGEWVQFDVNVVELFGCKEFEKK